MTEKKNPNRCRDLINVVQKITQRVLQRSSGGDGWLQEYSILKKYSSGTDIEKQNKTERQRNKDRHNGSERKKTSLVYLLSLPAGPHQKTAYLSATLTSSNRPGTVANTNQSTWDGAVTHTLSLQRSWQHWLKIVGKNVRRVNHKRGVITDDTFLNRF